MDVSKEAAKIKSYPLRLPENDFKRLEVCAKLLRTPVSKIIIQAIMLYLRELERKLNIQEGEPK